VTGLAGSFALAVALFGGLAACLLWLRVARRPAGGTSGCDAAVQATWLMLAGAAGACGALEWALLRDDFSLRFVAENSSRATPLMYKVTALWSALDGSLLLWLLVLASYALLVARGRLSAAAGRLQPWAALVACAVAVAFAAMTLAAAHPFDRLTPAASDGPGPNPLLADHPAMAVHPPLLYLGYTGLVVPFAYAVAALVVGDAGRAWLELTCRWVFVAWTCLTAGIVLGGWWSYAVLGWGGYWAWDPVENASLLPWLTATALLHGALVQRRGRGVALWNVALAAASFLLVCAGTFLTRSGVVQSVHAFTTSPLGPLLLGVLLLAAAVVTGLLIWRGDRLIGGAGDQGAAATSAGGGVAPRPPWVSRDTALLANNLLLVVLAAAVLLGTLLPVLASAAGSDAVSVGAPYYDRLAVPVAAGLLVLLVLGPLAHWDGDDPRELARRATVPAGVGALTVGVLGIGGVRGVGAVLVLGLAAAVATVAVRRMTRGLSRTGLRGLARRRRALAGDVAHLGLAVLVAGVAGSSAWTVVSEGTIGIGQALAVPGVEVRLLSVERAADGVRMITGARVQVVSRGVHDGVALPALAYYPGRDMTVTLPAVRSSWREDVYLTTLGIAQDGSTTTLRLAVNPLVGWVWAGGALLLLGGLVAAVPGRRRRAAAARVTATGPAAHAPAEVAL
jgi:cytochrome c-type biogenesis protein CcmF